MNKSFERTIYRIDEYTQHIFIIFDTVDLTFT